MILYITVEVKGRQPIAAYAGKTPMEVNARVEDRIRTVPFPPEAQAVVDALGARDFFAARRAFGDWQGVMFHDIVGDVWLAE